ncbi:Uncharacterised protein [Serratia quinivorans]|nr:Uncharacterised protein [Serratia quinivorans]
MAVDHRLLHAVQLALLFQVLYGDQLLAMQRTDKRQAGVNAAIAQPFAVRLRQHHGAGATVAGSAAFFGATAAEIAAQIIKHRGIGVDRAFIFQRLIKQKLDHAASCCVAGRYTTLPST